MVAKSARLVEIAQTACQALTQWTGQNAFYVRRVLGAVLKEPLMARLAKTVLLESTRLRKEFRKSRDAMNVVLVGTQAKRRQQRHAPNVQQGFTRMKLEARLVSASPMAPSYWVVQLLWVSRKAPTLAAMVPAFQVAGLAPMARILQLICATTAQPDFRPFQVLSNARPVPRVLLPLLMDLYVRLALRNSSSLKRGARSASNVHRGTYSRTVVKVPA